VRLRLEAAIDEERVRMAVELKDVGALVAALGGLLVAVIGVLKYLSNRDKQLAAQTAFQNIVNALASPVEAQRLGAAILLRRFFDPKSELGEGRMPFAREAVGVIAAVLRETPTGNFQKLLADGLLYAPTLADVDLQRTNLQGAYLGRKQGRPAPNLRGADFYRADLSAASFKEADVSQAAFYQTRLHNTIFKNADLRQASFFDADLLGAEFKGARLAGAHFGQARNLPPVLRRHLDEQGAYGGPEVFPESTQPQQGGRPRVFISKPGTLSVAQQEFVREMTVLLNEQGIGVATVDRSDYPKVGGVAEVRRVLSGCAGALIIGFRQLEVAKGLWRAGTQDARHVEGVALPTTWNHVEAGMAAMVGLPMLFLVERGVIDGVFELDDVGHVVLDVDLAKPKHAEIRRCMAAWCDSVREAKTVSA
jgi:hypothetical protein